MSINQQIYNAQVAYNSSVAAYTLEDMFEGNAGKDITVEKCLENLDRLVRTKAVREQMAKIRKQLSY